MKTPSLSVFLIFAAVFLFTATSTLAGQSGIINPMPLEQGSIAVEDLAAEYHTDSGTVIVTAKIKNVSHSLIRGYATVYLLSAEGKKIHAYQEDVNNGEIFGHGVIVDFKAESKVSDLSKVASISVDFTQN